MLVDKILFFVGHKLSSNNISVEKYIDDRDRVMVNILDDGNVIVKFRLEEIYEGCIEHGSHFFDHFINKLKERITKKIGNCQ